MLLSRDDSGSGSKTEQSVALLEQKWHVVSSKMEERKVSPPNTVCDDGIRVVFGGGLLPSGFCEGFLKTWYIVPEVAELITSELPSC